MDKLQLYITTSQAEFQTRVEINADPYVQRWVCDLRKAVKQVDYSNAGISIFYMLKYIDTGVFIVALRTIPKSPSSHLAAWIYIPYSLRIADKDVMKVVNFITSKVEASEVSSKDIAQMHDVFMHDYEEDVLYPIFVQSQGLNYAYRYYGPRTGTTLEALLGQYRYQPCYLSFAGVLLINQDITTNVAGTNLTSAPLEDMAVLLPPAQAEVNGYHPTVYGQDFDMPTYVPMSRNIDIVWIKDGATDIRQAIYVAQPEMRAPSLNLQAPTPIPIREPLREPIHDPSNDPSSDTAGSASSAPVVDSDDKMAVPERKKVYHFQIPAKSAAIGTVIEFEITTNTDLASSPIDGYEATSTIQEGAGRSNHLIYKVADSIKDKWLYNGLFALGGAVIGALIMLLCLGTCNRHSSDETVNKVAVVTPVEPSVTSEPSSATTGNASSAPAEVAATAATEAQTEQADRSLEAAIAYLDTNTTWEKTEMEAYPDLQGLYNDMNNIERKKLVEVWGPKLKDSRAFTNVARHARLSYKKKARHTPFNSPDKTSLYVQAYLNNIDP